MTARAKPADRTIPWRISGSEALRDLVEQVAPTVSGFVDRAVRSLLEAEGHPVPPPLPPKHNGPRTKAKRRKRSVPIVAVHEETGQPVSERARKAR